MSDDGIGDGLKPCRPAGGMWMTVARGESEHDSALAEKDRHRRAPVRL